MSWNNKVIWSEGMFLRPQHFQQNARYVEDYVNGRCGGLRSHGWGFTELTLDQQLLSLGKIGISVARGVFPDGTPFNIPDDDDPPAPIDVPENVRDAEVFLALPVRKPGGKEAEYQDVVDTPARYVTKEHEVRDVITGNGSTAPIEVGKLRLRLLLETEQRDEYACLGFAKIVEVRTDKNVVIEEQYFPTVLDCQAAPGLSAFLTELQGLLSHRATALAGRVSASGHGGAAEIADFLLLQVVNRFQPLVAHLAGLHGLHPESFYRDAVSIAGELATFTSPNKLASSFEAYRHDALWDTFQPVIKELRQSLSTVLEQNAITIPLKEKKFGIRVATIEDRSLIGQASFVLAVTATIPTEELRKRFPNQIKIGPVEQIRELVNLALPGISVRPLAVAPRQIPYHSGYVYFELDRASEYWKQLQTSGGFAIHVGGDFPGLEMEFWAIRS